jgi:hypothetical protein
VTHWRWYSKLLLALLVAAFAYFVWPTPWMYFTVPSGSGYHQTDELLRLVGTYGEEGRVVSAEGSAVIVRVHRITGSAQTLAQGVWSDHLRVLEK